MSYIQSFYKSRTRFIVENIKMQGNELDILDIGCVGEGNTIHNKIIKRTKDDFKSFTGMDIDPAIKLLTPELNVTYENFSIYALKDNAKYEKKFDVIILAEVIEHLQDTFMAINSLKYVLKDNGVILMTYPNPFSLSPLIRFFMTNDPLSEKQLRSFCGCPEHIFIPALPVFYKYLRSMDLIVKTVGYIKPRFSMLSFFHKFAPTLGLVIYKK
jgi:2-polyprenyl-3-methyl-5-hydroxy-6-metoxy-1,4-benzoquinol methylase